MVCRSTPSSPARPKNPTSSTASSQPTDRRGTASTGQNGPVAMRTDCKHYESRTYSSGEVVRRCALDLAPEAPWKCPENCPSYERRMIDVGWQYGTLSKGMQ